MSTIFKFGYLPIFLMTCCFDSIGSQPLSSGKKEKSAAYKRIQLLDVIEDSGLAPAAKKPLLQPSDSEFPPLWELDRRLRRIVQNNFECKTSNYPFLQSRLFSDEEGKDENGVVKSLLRKLICLSCFFISQKHKNIQPTIWTLNCYKSIYNTIEVALQNGEPLSKFNDEKWLSQFLDQFFQVNYKLSPGLLIIPEPLKDWCLKGIVPEHFEKFKKLFTGSCQKWIKDNLEDQQAEQLYTAMFQATDRYSTVASLKEKFVEAVEANFDDPELGGAVFLLPSEEYEFMAKEIAGNMSLDKQKS